MKRPWDDTFCQPRLPLVLSRVIALVVWFRLPSPVRFSLLSSPSTEPKLVLSGSMRTREYTTRGSTARSSIDSPFVSPRSFFAGSRDYANTTDVSSPLSYIGILLKKREQSPRVFFLHASEKVKISTVIFVTDRESAHLFCFISPY